MQRANVSERISIYSQFMEIQKHKDKLQGIEI